jgi:4'-phosphopantetheinyl transferase
MTAAVYDPPPIADATRVEAPHDAAPLATDMVDVWCASLDEQTRETEQRLHALLCPEERTRASRFRFARDQRRFAIGRGIARVLLGRYLDWAPHEIAFSYGPHGKPSVGQRGAASAQIHFNLAHSEGLALFAFTRGDEVGVDVEFIRELPEWERLAESTFSPDELACLRSQPVSMRHEHFFRAWARQEALLKAHGTGLTGTMKAPGVQGNSYNVYPLKVAHGAAAAIAVRPHVQWLTIHPWQPDGAHHAPPAIHRSHSIRLGEHVVVGPNFL